MCAATDHTCAVPLSPSLTLLINSTRSLLILECETAMDITPLSIYADEKESLLAPGIKLKVKSRKKKGLVSEIRVVEVGNVLFPSA